MKDPIKKRIHRVWKDYKKWQKANAGAIREGQEITSLWEFGEIYRESGMNVQAVKDAVRYQMSRNTWKSVDMRVKELTGKHIATQKRGISTRDAAALINDQIKAFISDMEAEDEEALRKGEIKRARTSKEKALAVSAYFFGS